MYNSLTKQKFVDRATLVHGTDKFSYEFVEYKNYQTKIKIVCTKHNYVFEQTPNNHLSGQGCPLCKREATSRRCRSNTADFISKALVTHGESKYNYDKVVYKTSLDKVVIVCHQHGEFTQTPHDHLAGKGCPLCWPSKVADEKRLNTDIFISRAKLVHGDSKYNYDLVEYAEYHSHVSIVCPTHGIFRQRPANHLTGVGCPLCANYGFDLTEKAVLYIHNIIGSQHSFTGYGITRGENVRRKRHQNELSKHGYVISCSYVTQEFDGKFISQLEKLIIETFPTDKNTSEINGFKRESTTADYATVVAFVQNYIAEHNNKQESEWQSLTLQKPQTEFVSPAATRVTSHTLTQQHTSIA